MKWLLLIFLTGLAAGRNAPRPQSFQAAPAVEQAVVEKGIPVPTLIQFVRSGIESNPVKSRRIFDAIFPAIAAVFDVNNDGQLGIEEDHGKNYALLSTYSQVILGEPTVSQREWGGLDANGDRRITEAEVRNVVLNQPSSPLWRAVMTAAVSRTLDFDRDGRIERPELRLLLAGIRAAALSGESIPFLQGMNSLMPEEMMEELQTPVSSPTTSFLRPQSSGSRLTANNPVAKNPIASPGFPVKDKIEMFRSKIKAHPYRARAIMAQNHKATVAILDRNGDGRLTQRDLRRLYSALVPYWNEHIGQLSGRSLISFTDWLKMDGNQDGLVSDNEFLSLLIQRPDSAMWDALAALPFLLKFDSLPQDGHLTPSEKDLIKATHFRQIFELP